MREEVEQADREVVAWEGLVGIRSEAATRGAAKYGGRRVSQLELLLSKAEAVSGGNEREHCVASLFFPS